MVWMIYYTIKGSQLISVHENCYLLEQQTVQMKMPHTLCGRSHLGLMCVSNKENIKQMIAEYSPHCEKT